MALCRQSELERVQAPQWDRWRQQFHMGGVADYDQWLSHDRHDDETGLLVVIASPRGSTIWCS